MSARTIRLINDKHQCLKALAQSRGNTLKRLIDDITKLMLVENNAETRYQLRATRGADKEQLGLELLAKAELCTKSGQGNDRDTRHNRKAIQTQKASTELALAT